MCSVHLSLTAVCSITIPLLAKNTNRTKGDHKGYRLAIHGIKCVYSYPTDKYETESESEELSSEQNKIEENVIVYESAMTLLEIILFPLRITRDR